MTEHSNDNRIWSPVLLDWFSSHRRDLPWRENHDPYRVWVSEIMLQQTKVEAVRPYFDSWMEKFPTVQALAEASQDEVLCQWQGLGYYSRARNLHEAVCEVQKKYGGVVPHTKQEVLQLKGVGDYTAGAILSIAYGQKVAAVDGNVLRVFARIYNISENILSPTVKKKITKLVEQQLPADCPGDFNEALMDFGASVCIPKHPRCAECPLTVICAAQAAGTTDIVPVRLTKKNIPTEEIMVAIVSCGTRFLIHRRPATGLLASMWEFPNIEGQGEAGRQDLCRYLADKGCKIQLSEQPLGKLRHVFSHKIWNMTAYEAELISGDIVETKEAWQWLERSRYTEVPWAGPHGKLTAW